jgi:hypothetical protein
MNADKRESEKHLRHFLFCFDLIRVHPRKSAANYQSNAWTWRLSKP